MEEINKDIIVDYQELGKRIKKLRLEKKITQEKLAETVNISNSHMSHIETGITKASLEVIVSIANALCITTDQLLCDSLASSKSTYENELTGLLSDCGIEEIRFLTKSLKAHKEFLREFKRRN